MNDNSPDECLSVADAAERLGLTEDAIRKRIHRGRIRYAQDENGRFWVYLNQTDQTNKTDNSTDSPHDLSIQHLDSQLRDMRDEISFLRRKLDESDEANKENRRIIAALTQRIPAIEAPNEEPAEPRESTVSTSENTSKDEVPPDTEKRTWWQRMFGG